MRYLFFAITALIFTHTALASSATSAREIHKTYSELSSLPLQSKLYLSTPLECLAATIYFEAQRQAPSGQFAVASVVLNRAQHPNFPQEICGVVKQGYPAAGKRCQFSWYCDGKPDRIANTKVWKRCLRIAYSVLTSEYFSDPTSGALFYHASYVKPFWVSEMTPTGKIGDHIFYTSVRLQRTNSR